MKGLREALGVVVVLPGQTVHGEDERVHIVMQAAEVRDLVSRMRPTVDSTVVAVLHHKGAAVDTAVDPSSAASPVIQMGGDLRDVSQAIRPEVVHYHPGVRVGGPVGGWAGAPGVFAVWSLALLGFKEA